MMVDFLRSGQKPPGNAGAPIIDYATQAMVRSAVESYFTTHPLPEGRGPTPEEIESVVTAWLIANPPAPSDTVDVSGSVQAYLAENMGTILAPHINSPTPHPAYDNIPSLVLIYENGLI